MNLCSICGARVLNSNPYVRLCGSPVCSEVKRTGKPVEMIVRDASKIPDDRMESFGLGRDGKYARKIEHE